MINKRANELRSHSKPKEKKRSEERKGGGGATSRTETSRRAGRGDGLGKSKFNKGWEMLETTRRVF